MNIAQGEWRKCSFIGDGTVLPYQIWLPGGYKEKKGMPVMLFLHGDGLLGTDNEKQLSTGECTIAKRAAAEKGDIIIIAPQTPEPWIRGDCKNNCWHFENTEESDYLSAAEALLDDVTKRLCTDEKRIYLCGYSRGAFAVWYLLAKHPGKWAAAIPCCGAGDPGKAPLFADVPIWAFHGDADTVVPCENTGIMINALKKAGGNPRFTVCRGLGHGLRKALEEEPEVIDWLFSK